MPPNSYKMKLTQPRKSWVQVLHCLTKNPLHFTRCSKKL